MGSAQNTGGLAVDLQVASIGQVCLQTLIELNEHQETKESFLY